MVPSGDRAQTHSCHEGAPAKLCRHSSHGPGIAYHQDRMYPRIDVLHTVANLAKRDSAFRVLPLATIGEFWFLVLGLLEHPQYSRALDRLLKDRSQTLIDLGTCLGQDIRKLIYDGVSPSQLCGVDKYSQFFDVGNALFGDKDNTEAIFKTGDLLADEDPLWSDTTHQWDIVISCQLLHAFDLRTQERVVRRMLSLAKGTGSWLFGVLAGDLDAHEVPVLPPLVPEGCKVTRYIHNVETLRNLFERICEEDGVSAKVIISVQEDPDSTYTKELRSGYFTTANARILSYSVELL